MKPLRLIPILFVLCWAFHAAAQTYQMLANGSLLRLADQAVVPADSGNADYRAYLAWVAAGNAPPVYIAPASTLAQQAQQALAACAVTITSTATPALSATYPCDPATQGKLASVVTSVVATQGFPGGATVYPMKTASGAWVPMTPTQYVTVAGAIASFVGQLDLIADGNPANVTALPSNAAQIP